MTHPNKIFDVVRALGNVEAKVGLDKMDLKARQLLTFIGDAEAQDRVINVGDAVKESGIGTPPTVYSNLAKLERAGWIRCVPDPRDGRAVKVIPAEKARAAFRRMSAAVARAVGA